MVVHADGGVKHPFVTSTLIVQFLLVTDGQELRMRLLVTGDRNWQDAIRVYNALDDFRNNHPIREELILISGDARGADTYADVCGQLLGFTIERYPADWETYKRAAGPIRNKQMLDSGVDYCIAFHDDLGSSRGTRNMVEQCEKAGIKVELIGNDTR